MEAIPMSHVTVYYYKPLQLKDMDGLLKAARIGDLDDVIRLVAAGHDVNERGPQYNLTALHLASLHGHLEVVQFLLDNGADPDVLDSWQCTPLHNAAGGGHPKIVRELCEAGASLDKRNATRGRTPLDIARDKDRHDVVPIIMDYLSKASKLTLHNGKVLGPDPQSGRKNSHAGGKKGGGLVIRWKDRDHRHQPVEEPAEVEARVEEVQATTRSVTSAKLSAEKQALQEQLRQLEVREQLRRLDKAKQRAQNELFVRRQDYEAQLEQLEVSICDLQTRLEALTGERDAELEALASELHEIDQRMGQLKIKDN